MPDRSETTVLGESDHDRPVEVPVGATLEVTLAEGTTGYRWQLSPADSRGVGSVVLVDPPRAGPPPTRGVGAFHPVTFPVATVAPGRAEIVLLLRQPWDPESEARRLSFPVVVR